MAQHSSKQCISTSEPLTGVLRLSCNVSVFLGIFHWNNWVCFWKLSDNTSFICTTLPLSRKSSRGNSHYTPMPGVRLFYQLCKRWSFPNMLMTLISPKLEHCAISCKDDIMLCLFVLTQYRRMAGGRTKML